MYDTKFECRYYKDDVFLETDDVNDEEKGFIRDILYKEDLLNIFSIDISENTNVFDNVFESIISELYNKIKHCSQLKNCMKKMASILMSEDEEFGLIILYSYDYMHITHKCISEYLDTGLISKENIELLDKISK